MKKPSGGTLILVLAVIGFLVMLAAIIHKIKVSVKNKKATKLKRLAIDMPTEYIQEDYL